MKSPEFCPPYMAILGRLASDLASAAKVNDHDASVMGRILRSRVRTARFARAGLRGRIRALMGKVWGE
jgi:hypothetical protein